MKVRISYEHEASSRAAEGTYVLKTVQIAGRSITKRVRPVGMVLEGADVHKLIGCGLADPADDEAAALYTPEQIRLAKATGHPYLMQMNAEATKAFLEQQAANAAEVAAAAEADIYDEVENEEGTTEEPPAVTSGTED